MSGMSTIRIELLNKENFDTWKLQIEALLIKHDYWEYVNGSRKRSEDEDGANWDIADRKARSDLILAISPSELKQIKDCKTSNEVWQKLHTIYQSKGPARKATLLKQLTLHKMESGEDVREHIARFFDAVDKLKDMDVSINDDLLTVMLLYGLPREYENFRCAIESRDELPNPESLKVKIIEENDARKQKERDTNAALMVKKGPFRQKGNFHGFRNKTVEPFRYKCHRCKKVGHKASECETKFKMKHQNAGKVDELGFQVVLSTNEEVNMKKSYRWCLDSGCTSHMCHDRNKFEIIEESTDKMVNLACSVAMRSQMG